MNFIRNLLALIGLLTVIGIIWAFPKAMEMKQAFDEFEPKAIDTYKEMYNTLLETGNAAEATVWKVKVKEGLTTDDVEQTMKFVANEHNFKNVGELPLSQQVEAMSGQKYRFIKIFLFCDAMTAARMIDFSDAYSAYLPCRVNLLEDKQGDLWIYTLNMDPMIYGGKPLPPGLREEAMKVREIILDIINRGAEGEF